MSNMNPDIILVNESDRPNLQLLRHFLNAYKDVTYIHVNHLCPTPNHTYLKQSHIKLVVYSTLFYQDILAIVIGDNARILPEDAEYNVSLDRTAALIGLCVCNTQTQP